MTTRRALFLVALVLIAGCTWGGTPGIDGEQEGSPTVTTTEPAAGTPTTTGSPTVTPPAETPAATFVVDGEARAAITLEVADNRSERRQGLMGRESLERNHGMLFVFDSEDHKTFWMKNTLIPLDMIFLDANGTVVDVEHASPEPNASDDELERYRSDDPAKYVIEVNRGFANRTGVGPGTRVQFHGNETLLTPEP